MALVMAWLVWRSVVYQLWPLYFIRTIYKTIPDNTKELKFNL